MRYFSKSESAGLSSALLQVSKKPQADALGAGLGSNLPLFINFLVKDSIDLEMFFLATFLR